MSFDQLGLSAELLRAIAESGYTTPTPIQAQAIPVALSGRDIIGIAQTGTGKTAGFTLPMIQKLSQGRAKARMPRSLILEPTRELAAQVAESFEKYGKYHKLSMALLIGGVSFGDQDAKISRGVDVLIATPGRLLDHFERGKLLLNGVQTLVIDEADRMLDMGFIPDIERICKLLPTTRQTLFFSATMPPEIKRLADAFLNNPQRIEVSKPATAATTIEQRLIVLPSHDAKLKREALRRLIRAETVTNGIIFCNRKRDVDIVYKSLSKHGFNIAALHGDLPQPVRMKTLDSFRAGQVQLLVASDVAARGLDIPEVSHVFNYDVPIHADDYVHRIGRTGRAGRSGVALMLSSSHDAKFVQAIEKLKGQQIPRTVMEGLDEFIGADAAHARDRGDRRGGRDRDRRRKDRGYEHKGPHHEHVASMDPIDVGTTTVEAASEAPVAEAAAPAPREHKPRHHDKPRREHHEQKPREQKAEHKSEHKSEHKARDEHKHREPKHAGEKKERHEKRDRHENNRNENKKERDENKGNNQQAVGLGDHTPAFLLRPVPKHLLRSKKDPEAA